jgi:hypothetical protein
LRQKTEESKKLQDEFEGLVIQKALPGLARSIANSRLPAEVQAKLEGLAKAAVGEFKKGRITQASLLVNRIQAQVERKAAAARPSEAELQAEITRRQERQNKVSAENKGAPYLKSGSAIANEIAKLKDKIQDFAKTSPDRVGDMKVLIGKIKTEAVRGDRGTALDLIEKLKGMLAEQPAETANV